jgi:hypothetical protein
MDFVCAAASAKLGSYQFVKPSPRLVGQDRSANRVNRDHFSFHSTRFQSSRVPANAS